MLFEIHDILLHRLWKAARKNLANFVNNGPIDLSPRGVKCDINRYKWLRFWETTTKRWYMNHVRRCDAIHWHYYNPV